MDIRNWTAFAVLSVFLALMGVAWAADGQVDSAGSADLAGLRQLEDILKQVSMQHSPNSPEVVNVRQALAATQKDVLERAHMREDRANMEMRQLNSELHEIQSQLREKTGRMDVSPENLESTVESLEKEKEALMLADVAAKARRDAMEEAIAEQTAKADKIAAVDATIDALRKGVEAREKQLDLIQQQVKSGVNTQDTVVAAQASLADAEARVAERLSALSGEAGGNLSSALSRELLDLNIEEKEREAKMQFIEKRLKTLGEALQMADNADLVDLMRQRESAGVVEENARHNLQAIQDEIEASKEAAPAASQPSR
jgi:chromosome segregation ATPase